MTYFFVWFFALLTLSLAFAAGVLHDREYQPYLLITISTALMVVTIVLGRMM